MDRTDYREPEFRWPIELKSFHGLLPLTDNGPIVLDIAEP